MGELKKDLVKRDKDFVHRGGLRSGWDDEDDSTTAYVLRGELKPLNAESELREINSLCRNRAEILADGKPIAFTINPKEETAKTDGKRVFVGTSVLAEAKSFEEKADIMVGLTTHEMAHVMHSDFKILTKAKDNFHKAIINVIEDERIEILLTEDFPGYAHNIAKTKKYFLEEKYLIDKLLAEEKNTAGTLSEEEKTVMELFDVFMRIVRYPKHIDDELLENYEVAIDDIKSVLSPYPMKPKDVLEKSSEIYDIIYREVKKKMEKDDGEGDEEESEGEEEGEGKSTKTKSSSEEEKKGKSSPGKGDEEKEESLEEKINKAMEETATIMKEIESINDPKVEDTRDVAPAVLNIKFNEEYIYDGDNQAAYRNGEPDRARYERLEEQVKAEASKLASVMFVRVFNESKMLYGMRNGNLDEGKIVEAAHGVRTVHTQKIEKESRKLNIVILIDESGSMGRKDNDKTNSAAAAAILIERAFKNFPMGQLFIYGFTSDTSYKGVSDENQIIRYREPGYKVPYGLGDVQGRCNNRDGVCIRSVAKRVRQFTREPAIFFVISDGQPSAGGYGGYTDTRHAVTEITKMNFFPIQIGIGRGIDPEDQKQMFDEFIHYNDPKQMVDDLRKLITKKAHKIFGL
jgi:hypothetical protein